MNAFKLLFLFSILIFTGCVMQPHKPEQAPVKLENGLTSVEVKFHKKDKVELGDAVGAYSKNCYEKTSRSEFQTTVCKTKLLGDGQITKILGGYSRVVEFDPSVEIDENTEFEVK